MTEKISPIEKGIVREKIEEGYSDMKIALEMNLSEGTVAQERGVYEAEKATAEETTYKPLAPEEKPPEAAPQVPIEKVPYVAKSSPPKKAKKPTISAANTDYSFYSRRFERID